MVVIVQFLMCLHKLQRLAVNVDDYSLSQNIMFPLMINMDNGEELHVIGGVFVNHVKECLIMIGHYMSTLCEDYIDDLIFNGCS
jgi:hypothetical protein